jgi:uncharacterized damage-inducible protein DinB
MHGKTLAHQLGLSAYVLERNLGELSHEDSLVRPQKGGNCLNWVLGHVTRSRNLAVGMLLQKHPFPMEDFNAYDDRGGVPFTRETALPLDELKRRFKSLQEPLNKALSQMSDDTLASPAPFSPTGNPDETMGTMLAAFVFHEVYHMGQVGLLRRVAGKEGVVKPAAEAAAAR